MYDKDKRWIYMLMEIYLSEEKAKKNNIDLNECYQKIIVSFLNVVLR